MRHIFWDRALRHLRDVQQRFSRRRLFQGEFVREVQPGTRPFAEVLHGGLIIGSSGGLCVIEGAKHFSLALNGDLRRKSPAEDFRLVCLSSAGRPLYIVLYPFALP
eukprot:scaffold48_cov311-Pinguiococcus_pyrenoidosus.AAC.284